MANIESSDVTQIETKVLQAVRNASVPQEPRAIIDYFPAIPASSVREAIRSLVNSGALQVTLDWKVRPKEG